MENKVNDWTVNSTMNDEWFTEPSGEGWYWLNGGWVKVPLGDPISEDEGWPLESFEWKIIDFSNDIPDTAVELLSKEEVVEKYGDVEEDLRKRLDLRNDEDLPEGYEESFIPMGDE